MRNKKYRPWKVILIYFVTTIFSFVLALLVDEKWEKIVTFVCGGIMVLLTPIPLVQFFEVQSDKIIARGTNSRNKAYNKSFTRCVFMFEDIEDITVEGNKVIWIRLKDGSDVSIPIEGHFNKQEIVSLVYEVRAQIKGYEQHYIDK